MATIDRAHHPIGAAEIRLAASPTLDPNYGGLEILGQIAYYHLLANRMQYTNPGDGEHAWVEEEIASIKTFLASVDPSALDPTMKAVLTQAIVNMGAPLSTFNTWWASTVQNMGGSAGPSILAYFSNISSANPYPGFSGNPSPDMLKLSFGITMIFADLERSGLAPETDFFFSARNPGHPLGLSAASESGVIAAYLYSEWGNPSGNWMWSNITNLLDPTQQPLPTDPADMKNYTNGFFPALETEVSGVDGHHGLTQDEINQIYQSFYFGFNNEFYNQ